MRTTEDSVGFIFEEESYRIEIDPMGFATEARPNGSKVSLTGRGMAHIRQRLTGVFGVCLEDLERIPDCIPHLWTFTLQDIKVDFELALKQLTENFMAAQPTGCVSVNPLLPECGCFDADGKLQIVLTHKDSTNRIRATHADQYVSLRATNALNFAIATAAVVDLADSAESQLSIIENSLGLEVRTFDLAVFDAVFSQLDELDLPLRDFEFCKKNKLLSICKVELRDCLQSNQTLVDF